MITEGMRNHVSLRSALIIGCASASLLGAGRMLAMAHSRDSPMGLGMPTHPLMGMSLEAMPEMFLAGAALVALVVVLWRQGAPPVAPLRIRPRTQLIVCTMALCIDVSKTATLGFVIPGIRHEYGIGASTAALLATAGLTGTAVGALAVRAGAHRLTDRQVYVLGTLAFTATSACGSMPTFIGNLTMCFLMGIAVGGLAPVLIAAIRNSGGRSAPTNVVVASLIAGAAGFFIAAGSAAWLEPIYGWRILWLIGAPTGLLLLLLAPAIPEARRSTQASEITAPATGITLLRPASEWSTPLTYLHATFTGIATFSITTWAPTLAAGSTMGGASSRLTLISLGMLVVAALLALSYRSLGEGRSSAIVCGATGLAVAALLLAVLQPSTTWLLPVALLGALLGVNSMAGLLLPAVANMARDQDRIRTVSTVSASNRVGGMAGPVALAPLVGTQAAILAALAAISAVCLFLGARLARQHSSRRTPRVDGSELADVSTCNG